MISKIWNWIKNKFKPEKQDPHLVLYEEVKTEPETPVYIEEDGKLKHCTGHLRFRKSCPRCQEIVQ